MLQTVRRFFGGFFPLFKNIDDPREANRITYPLHGLLFTGVLLFLFRLGARRQIGYRLRTGPAVSTFEALFGVNAVPHGDTLNDAFKDIKPEQVQKMVTGMTKSLIRKKILYRHRLLDRYYVIATDGTGIHTFGKRHCPHCLTKTSNGKTIYYHTVLEAKLVTPNGFSFSVMTEFIENPDKNPTKQDCELKAFGRLSEKLKNAFPHLPILLVLDGLYAGGPTFALCEKYGWKYMVVLKDKDLPTIHSEFEALTELQPENRLTRLTGKNAEIRQEYRWVDSLLYIDSVKREHTVSVLECFETKPDRIPATTKFMWITNCRIKRNNVAELAENGGRIRWKIENEGFNVQKNGGYELEHAYTNDYGASKIFYLLLQVAHNLMQLLEKGSLLRKAFPGGFGSVKNIAASLLEAWRNTVVTAEEIATLFRLQLQIRFDTS